MSLLMQYVGLIMRWPNQAVALIKRYPRTSRAILVATCGKARSLLRRQAGRLYLFPAQADHPSAAPDVAG